MPELYTQSADRPDLEQLAVNMPEGFIGPQIFPVKFVTEKAGSMTVVDVNADLTTQVGRATGAAINSTIVAKQSVSFACVRHEARAEFDIAETVDSEGVAGIDAEGARLVKRAIAKDYEGAVYAEIFNAGNAATAIVAATGEIIPAIQSAAKAVKGVKGDLALVLSADLYSKFIRLDEVKGCLDTGVYVQLLNMDGAAQMSKKANFIVNLMQTVYPFSAILVGDDDIWNTYDYQSYMAVVKLPKESPKQAPVLGAGYVYIPTGVTSPDGIPCKITSYADMKNKLNQFDGECWMDVVTYNEEGIKLIDVSADISPVTTTTATTI